MGQLESTVSMTAVRVSDMIDGDEDEDEDDPLEVERFDS